MSVLAEGEVVNQLPMAPMWFAIIALIVFGMLLAVTWAFRGAANRHDPRAFAPVDHGGHGSGASTGGH